MEMSYQRLRERVDPSLIPYRSSLDSKEYLARERYKTRVSFHGTKLRNVRSIARWGFVKPGEKAGENTVDGVWVLLWSRGLFLARA
jgi:hypothetical protein